jgi:hypothetical protein
MHDDDFGENLLVLIGFALMVLGFGAVALILWVLL